MSHTLELSDDLYRALERYAQERHQTAEEALAALVRGIVLGNGTAEAATGMPDETSGANGPETQAEYLDPWEGFRGKFEAKYRDLIERHDYYIGQAALETHADEDADE